MNDVERLNQSRIAFSELMHFLGGTTVLRTILDDAEQARLKRGAEGTVFTDACEDEEPTLMIVARADEVEFKFTPDDEPSHVLPMGEAERLLHQAETPPEVHPPMAA